MVEKGVEAEVEKERERNSRTITVEGRPVEDKDMTTLDFEGFVDGEAFEGGKGESYPLTIGSGSFIPGFEEQVEGMNIGEDRDITVKFPEEYHEKSLAGKDAVFAIKLHEITFKEIPALDDESVKDISEFDTVADYKESVKKNIAEKKNSEAESKLENDMIEAIAKNSQVEIPQCMIDNQIEDMIKEFENRLQYQGLKSGRLLQVYRNEERRSSNSV